MVINRLYEFQFFPQRWKGIPFLLSFGRIWKLFEQEVAPTEDDILGRKEPKRRFSKTKIILFVVLIVLVAFFLNSVISRAQITFSGLGRTVVQKQQIAGNLLNNDTASDRLTAQGYTLFDLRTEFRAKNYLKGVADVRLKNTFGGFGGVGVSVAVRQILVEGLISRYVKYSVGDIDLKMSPFTFWNSTEIDPQFEGDLFQIRRKIVQYESFNVDNQWRMQGAKAFSYINLKGDSNRIRIDAFAARNRVALNNELATPFTTGGRAGWEFKDWFFVKGNLVGFQEEVSKTLTTKIQAASGELLTKQKIANFDVQLAAETGISNSHKASGDSSSSKHDFFVAPSISASYTPLNLQLTTGYREVGASFESPAAQTIRLRGDAVSSFLPSIGNGLVNRQSSMLDRLGAETIQNQNLSSFRQPYLMQYGLISPYGMATPNRKGFFMGINLEPPANVLVISANLERVSELSGEGQAEKRKFSQVQLGSVLNLHRLLKIYRKLSLNGSFRQENASRSGILATDLTRKFFELGATYELFPKLECMLGFKQNRVRGNEIYSLINSYNEIYSYQPVNMNVTENLSAFALRYNFSDSCFLMASGFFSRMKDANNEASNYRLYQLFTNFSVAF